MRPDWLRLGQLQACLESALRAVLIAEHPHTRTIAGDRARWIARAEGSLCFAGALEQTLRSRRCLTR